MNKLLKSNDFSLFSAYKSRNAEFRRVPNKLSFVLPSVTKQEKNKEEIHQQFGFLLALFIKTETYSNTADGNVKGAKLSPSAVPLLDIPPIITDINAKYRGLLSVSSLSDEGIWLGQDHKTLQPSR